MLIDNKVRAVERLFSEIDKSTQLFLGNTSLQCPIGCSKCCHGQNIAAAPLEFLPYAYHLFNKGTLEDQYWDLKIKQQNQCFLVYGDDGLTGKCSAYEYRGVVCRLFGNAASVDKNGNRQFSACSILKAQIVASEKFEIALQSTAPIYTDFYARLRAIDNDNGAMMFPINIAILKAMELVYNMTHRKRKRSV